MGVDTRRPQVPAPTESMIETTGGSATGTGTDLATDVSRRTDRTSYSVPDDGSPITISTRRRAQKRDGEDSLHLSRSSHQSATSLLIEYFEEGKGPSGLGSRPSVRVKVTPSVARRRNQTDRIQISETSGKKPLYTRRISLSTPRHKPVLEAAGDDRSLDSDVSAGDEHITLSRRLPLEIELDQGSELSNDKYIQPTSEISTMPPDSILDSSLASPQPRRKRSQSLHKEEDQGAIDLLKAPSRRRSRSLSRERIAFKAAQKLSSAAGDSLGSPYKRSDRSRNRSISVEPLDVDSKFFKKRSHRYRDEEPPSAESSLVSGSAISSHRKSGDQYSFRSSRSSLNNPKLLETVEDAIRRLILPELKEIKKDQIASKFERDIASAQVLGSSSKGELGRRLSKRSSAPDVTKSTAGSSSGNGRDDAFVLTEDYSWGKEELRREKTMTPSPSEKAHARRGSRPEYTEEDKLRRKRSKGLLDAEAAAIVGTALSAAALQRHDSPSLDMDDWEHKDSKTRSRTGSINDTETELLFRKHNVALMPMRSEMDSELTRESILSQRTVETPTPRPGAEIHAVRRNSREIRSPSLRTPTRTPISTHQSNFGDRDLRRKSQSPSVNSAYTVGAETIAAAAANLMGGHLEHDEAQENHDIYINPRALSPVQSVSSEHREVEAEPDLAHHDDKLTPEGGEQTEPRLSIDSLSSAPSTELARSTRQLGPGLDSRSLIHDDAGTELGFELSPQALSVNHWDRNFHSEDGTYRHSVMDDGNESMDDARRLTNYTDGSFDPHYLGEVNTGRQVADGGFGANPEYVHPPVSVESAVASLLDPSILDVKLVHSRDHSQTDSLLRPQTGSPLAGEAVSRSLPGSARGSPLKQRHDALEDTHHLDEASFPKRIGVTSPLQSVTQSEEDQDQPPEIDVLTEADAQIPAGDNIQDTESEFSTNPSFIQGPIGGLSNENRDHWPYEPTPPRVMNQHPTPDHDSIGGPAAMAAGLAAGLGLASHEQKANYDHPFSQPTFGHAYDLDHNSGGLKDNYMQENIFSTPPGAKDEGYNSGANPMSPSVPTPEPRNKDTLGILGNTDDPFMTTTHQRHLSGYSHGIPSPLYDSATGRGIDRIQSKDIIALMDHLTVRDAQRNARDTEILVTLVRSAAEMRNSFEEMKKFIAEQDEVLIDATEKQHERTRAIGGPRPQLPKGTRQALMEEDVRSKRRNVFRRALKSLSLKSSNDLSKVEEMLEQLLDEVEALRAVQDGRNPTESKKATSINSNEQGGASYQDGYEPEGQAGTSSTGGHSEYTFTSSRPFPDSRILSGRKGSENRVSTVPEGDEELESQETYKAPSLGGNSPADGQLISREEHGVSEPVATPPREAMASGALSNETTPRKSEEKSRKHKSSSSSFFPRIMSRWSRTTASSTGDNNRNSTQPGRKDRPSSEVSHSGSDLANNGHYDTATFYNPHGDDRLGSSYTLDGEQEQEQERLDHRPPSPLVPSSVSENPKYQAHRDSFGLQHPQPRQGPSDRYQTQLESEARNFADPLSPNSDNWGSTSSLPQPNRYSGTRLTPISDTGYSEASSLSERRGGPPRPPKIKDDGPLIPQRAHKPKASDQLSYSERLASQNGRSSPSYPPPQRKPTGPRPITSASGHSPSSIKRQRYRGSPNHVEADADS